MIDIPLINESLGYATRLNQKVSEFGVSKYRKRELVNIIHKYDANYYETEKSSFLSNPDSYIQGIGDKDATVDAQYLRKKLPKNFLVRQVVKVLAHLVFRFLNVIYRKRVNHSARTIRRCYVDDVEGLFDKEEDKLSRLIYPFPLSVARQKKYVRSLIRERRNFTLCGLPYRIQDVVRMLIFRDYASFVRMEKRANFLHARELVDKFQDLELIECADEYEFGSYYFSMYSKRLGVEVYNCAHGIGKYLPYHNYSKFDVVTQAQADYYESFNKVVCGFIKIKEQETNYICLDEPCIINLIGQSSETAPSVLAVAEYELLSLMIEAFKDCSDVQVTYKPHPNSNQINSIVDQFPDLNIIQEKIAPLDGQALLQLSLFSTCQIDPNFKGEKVLIETDLIKPQLSFSNYETIVKISNVKDFLSDWYRTRIQG